MYVIMHAACCMVVKLNGNGHPTLHINQSRQCITKSNGRGMGGGHYVQAESSFSETEVKKKKFRKEIPVERS